MKINAVKIEDLKVDKDYKDDNGTVFNIYHDHGAPSPRETLDSEETLIILRGDMNSPDPFPDELKQIADECGTTLTRWCNLNAIITALKERGYFVMPVYVLSHGVVHYSVHDFGDRWDSWMAGFAYCKPVENEDYMRTAIEGDLDVYDAWANGEVYGISVLGPDGEVVDGENGFYHAGSFSMVDTIKEMMRAVGVKLQDEYEPVSNAGFSHQL